MIHKAFYSIFQQGSRTYFYSSLFFPNYLKKDVFTLYGFVRKADNFVDSIPQKINEFYRFKSKYYKALQGTSSGDIVIDTFVHLMKKHHIDPQWVDAFLHSMEMDVYKKKYCTLEETLEYLYGSAEVIGLMMAQIMKLPQKTHTYARYLGRAMQYINFIRDINEDRTLNRMYFPITDLQKYGLKNLDFEYTKRHAESYISFIREQILRYQTWQQYAEKGYQFIPKRILIPVKTASEMYEWTAQQIYSNPYLVYQSKVKPMILRILASILQNIVGSRKINYTLEGCLQSENNSRIQNCNL